MLEEFKGKIDRPFAALIRDSKITEDFFLFLFAERAERNKDEPFSNSVNINCAANVQLNKRMKILDSMMLRQ